MRRIIFLDLEETIIKSWRNRTFCNTERVKGILKDLEAEEIHIFSFAIDSEHDKVEFERPSFKNEIEKVLDVKIVSAMTTHEIMVACQKFTGIRFELYEFKLVWGKLRAFHDFCQASFDNAECVLIDDVVPNTHLINFDKNLIMRSIRV